MKTLNLYAGLGGNRLLWKDTEVTAVEIKKDIARLYKRKFPDDEVIIEDAHSFLIKNYKNYDFIWSSPPCVSHSFARWLSTMQGQNKPVYPDMSLWQEIIFLKLYCKVPFVVENVRPAYDPLIPPNAIIGRHYFWSNFPIPPKFFNKQTQIQKISGTSKRYGFSLARSKTRSRKDQILRNLVDPEIGLYIFELSNPNQKKTLLNQLCLFDAPG